MRLLRFFCASFRSAPVIGAAPQAFLAAYLVQRSPMLGWVFIGIGLAAMAGMAIYAFMRRRAG